MRILRTLPLLLLVVLAGLAPLSAQVFLEGDISRFGKLLPPPPADDSVAGLADLETVLEVQANRTPEQVARAERVAPHTPFLMGSTVLGPWFTPENLPHTATIMQAVWDQTSAVSRPLKKSWNRLRPPTRDARVHPCVKVPREDSYPSGHSTISAVWAKIYSAAWPEHAAEFEAQARETRWARILGGAHYPTDTQAGRILGEAIGDAMLQSPEMIAAIKEIRAETAPYRQPAAVGAGK